MQTVIDGVLTHYELVNPKGKFPLVILHGWGQTSSNWVSVSKLLSTSFRIFILDLPSFGGTRNLKLNADIPEYSDFVHSFVKRVGLKKFILAGQSFGGQIAGDFALKYPGYLNRLVLIDAAIIRTRSLKVKAKILVTKLIKPLTKLLPRNFYLKLLSLYTPAEYVRADLYQRGVLNQILKYDLSSRLHLIKVETDIVWGSEDKVIPYAGKLLIEKIKNSNLHLIYGAGHLPHETHPKKLADIINRFARDESA